MDPTDIPTMPLDDWLGRVAAQLGDSGADLALGARERTAILDLTRLAAHASERIAAPLTAFMLGAALGAQDADARAERMEAITAELARG